MECKSDKNGHYNTMVKIARAEFAILSQLRRMAAEIESLKTEVTKLRQEARKQARSKLEAEPSQSTKSGFSGKPIC